MVYATSVDQSLSQVNFRSKDTLEVVLFVAHEAGDKGETRGTNIDPGTSREREWDRGNTSWTLGKYKRINKGHPTTGGHNWNSVVNSCGTALRKSRFGTTERQVTFSYE